MEIWKSIPGYEDYEASNMGRIIKVQTGQELKQGVNSDGYLAVCFKSRQHAVHTLVLETFVGPRPEGQVCRHLNGVRTDSRLENLRWGTLQENVEDAIMHGTRQRKLSQMHIAEIKRLYALGVSINQLADRFGVSLTPIRRHLGL